MNTVNLSEYRWSLLQEPKCPSMNSTGFMLLLSAIDQGWQIEIPIQLINQTDSKERTLYLFTLTHKSTSMVRQITVPESAQLVKLLANEGLPFVQAKNPLYHEWFKYSA